ncbi:MAG: PaaI family thioesterase [Candidatus Dormibacteria bacterium]
MTVPPGLPGNLDPHAGFIGLMGLEFDEVSATRVVAHLEVTEKHLQPYGLVHGGVYASIAETLASVGAMVAAGADGSGRGAVGLENHTSFLRTAGAGQRIDAEAVVRHAGRRVHQWAVTMRDAESGRELATSTVRLLLVAPEHV